MRKKFNKIFVDVSNFYYRAYYDVKNRLEQEETIVADTLTQALKMLNRIERDYLSLNGKMVFLFDNSHSGINRRLEIDPEYKGNRTQQEQAFYRSLDFFHLVLMNYKDNYSVLKIEGYESDDLVKTLVEMNPKQKILLISNDLDWFRAISDWVHVAKYEGKDYVIYRPEEFEERFGFPASAKGLCIYKAFRGDSGDNVPKAVSGIRSKDLARLSSEYESVYHILQNLDNIDFLSENMKGKIKEATNRLMMNYKLVNYLDVSEDEIEDNLRICSFNPSTLNSLYKTIGIDIKTIDPRVFQFFPKKEISEGDFFKLEKIPRA